MPTDDVLFASIAEVAARYRDGSLLAGDGNRTGVGASEALNPTLNAFITLTAETAWRPFYRPSASDGPAQTAGWPTASPSCSKTWWIRLASARRVARGILAGHRPARDAAVWRYLQAAGAVLVGKTNLLEFAYGIVHPDFGPTWNPWDSGTHGRRFERRFGGRRGSRSVLCRRWHRYRRLHLYPGRLLWRGRSQANLWSGRPGMASSRSPGHWITPGPLRGPAPMLLGCSPVMIGRRAEPIQPGRPAWSASGCVGFPRPGLGNAGAGDGSVCGRVRQPGSVPAPC